MGNQLKKGPRELANLHSLALKAHEEKIGTLYRVMGDCILATELLIRKGLVTHEEIATLRKAIRSEQVSQNLDKRGTDGPSVQGSIQNCDTRVSAATSYRVPNGEESPKSPDPVDDGRTKNNVTGT
ncbi:MAG: hypothetical protein M0R80_13255 [Proteobacteria bacterium]|jgi:hypothetical protein|nr:hypothetical protein [Pseudomonadota bacterium]